MSGFSKVKMSAFRICTFAIFLSGRFDMLVSMSDKELKRLSVLQEICDQRITSPRLLSYFIFQSVRSDAYCRNTKLKVPAALAHAGRGQISNSRLPEELRLKCLNIVSDQLHGFGPTLAHEKLTTVMDSIFQ